MYEIENLFDIRSVVGTKVEQLLASKNCTKAELCAQTGVSRPTIDKLIAGTLTSKTNYEKHISKILNYLETTPDMLLAKTANQYSRTRAIRNLQNLSIEEVSKATGIPKTRLEQIESGEEATLAELRDIARCLSISVRVLTGENYFEPQIAIPSDYIAYKKDKNDVKLSGFWGHIGILLKNTDEYLWFRITNRTRMDIYSARGNERLVIPCMDNKLLYLYMPNVKEIILLDEACDQSADANWNLKVSEREISLSIYEALEDYVMVVEFDKEDDGTLSQNFIEYLDAFAEQRNWGTAEILDILNSATIYYEDGKKRYTNIDFDYGNESISEEIESIYEFGDSEFSENILFFTEPEGVEVLVNVKNISMIELPLLKVEKNIIERQREMELELRSQNQKE